MPRILTSPGIRELVSGVVRVLLVNAPAIDVRLPWSRWHQPTGLLQVGTALQKRGCQVRLIDCLQPDRRGRVTRRKVGAIKVEGYELDLWHYGLLWDQIARTLEGFKRDEWIPDLVFVSCFNTCWWQDTQKLIRHLKEDWLPGVPVILGGVYPSLESVHARAHTRADQVIVGAFPEAHAEIPELELYGEDRTPHFAGVYLYQPQSVTDHGTASAPRPPGDIASEIAHKAKLGVTEFAFFDDEIRVDQQEHFLETLDAIIKHDLDTRFVAVGNISPTFISGGVACRMGQAGYRQVFLKCDVTHSLEGAAYDTSYEVYRECTAALHREANLKPRSDQLTAMLLVGNPYENLEEVTERLVHLASIVGSVNLVQYQYSAGTPDGRMYEPLISQNNGHKDLTQLNCKLYPLARRTGNSYKDYVELTRLSALLNSKHRSGTFDFLSESIVGKAIQTSLREHGWDPFRVGPEHRPSETVIPVSSLEEVVRE